jgi:DNA-binding beta-propeller fold protein YncE
MHRRLAASLAAFSAIALVPAQDLGGGAPGSHGRVSRFVLESWIPGTPSALAFRDLPPGTVLGVAMLSGGSAPSTIPGVQGTFLVDFNGLAVAWGTNLVIPTLPMNFTGLSMVIQGVFLDPALGPVLTDATRCWFFDPVVMVGNQRQSSNSISVIDLVQRAVVDRLGNSENGTIAFSPDRTRAYVCEPGLQRNLVTVYDLTVRPIVQLTQLPTSGGVRYRPEIAPAGDRMYVPVHNGVDVFDVDPASPTFHQRLLTIPTPITGNSSTIFTGPLDVAVTPDGSKLFIAFGELLAWPAPSTVGVVDLLAPGTPYRAIPVTTGGDFFGLATRSAIVVSPDGQLVFTVEWAVAPGFPFANGFAQGGLINVISAAAETEILAIPTNGIAQSAIAIDRLGRNLWVAQNGALTGQAELLRIDVDRHSAAPLSVAARIVLDPVPFDVTTGAAGVAATPDGSTVCVTLVEDSAHPVPVMITVDARTNGVFGLPITVESLPQTVSVQQY